jgi:hypothetical protein
MQVEILIKVRIHTKEEEGYFKTKQNKKHRRRNLWKKQTKGLP